MKAKGMPAREINRAHSEDKCLLCLAAQGIYKRVDYASRYSLEKIMKTSGSDDSVDRNRRISNIKMSVGWVADNEGNISPVTLDKHEQRYTYHPNVQFKKYSVT
jgi:hypothetical protein